MLNNNYMPNAAHEDIDEFIYVKDEKFKLTTLKMFILNECCNRQYL